MKVPTFRKYGITKSQFETLEKKVERVAHYLSHSLPVIIGLIGGIIIYISVSGKFKPVTVFQYIQQVFILASIIIISIGISLLIFMGLKYVYDLFFKRTSDVYKKSMSYKEDRSRYDFWKLRLDDSYWLYLDGLSVEKEIIGLYALLGYSIRSEIKTDSSHLDYILINESGNSIYLRFHPAKPINRVEEINDIIIRENEINAGEIHVISLKSYNKSLPGLTKRKKNKIVHSFRSG